MAKPKQTSFTEEFEPVLVNAWGGTKNHLDPSHIVKTRQAISEIRRIYRFKGENRAYYPSRIQFRNAKNRAGYLAAFGQRHAYLTYQHLKKIEKQDPKAIPEPNKRGELTVTIIGAGAAVETYGICLFYNERSHKLRRLHLNLVEKVDEWKSTRLVMFGHLLQSKFPKMVINAVDIDADLTKDDCIHKFAFHHDSLIATDILLIYNVLNEIEVKHASKVWRNLKYILKQGEQPLIILLMEPCAPKARPRVDWAKQQLVQCSKVILDEYEEEIYFTQEPISIDFEGTNIGLNDRLFSHTTEGAKPTLQKSLRRTHIACLVEPHSPISREQVNQQLARLKIKRGKRGHFIRQQKTSPQMSFFNLSDDWNTLGHS